MPNHPAIDVIDAYRPLPGRMPGRLSPRHYDLLVLHANGAGYPEIASLLSIPMGTVKSGMHRARRALSLLAERAS